MSTRSHLRRRYWGRRPNRLVVSPTRPNRLLRRTVLLQLAGLILLFCAITSPLKLVFLASSESSSLWA
jgi:hypothetical protein